MQQSSQNPDKTSLSLPLSLPPILPFFAPTSNHQMHSFLYNVGFASAAVSTSTVFYHVAHYVRINQRIHGFFRQLFLSAKTWALVLPIKDYLRSLLMFKYELGQRQTSTPTILLSNFIAAFMAGVCSMLNLNRRYNNNYPFSADRIHLQKRSEQQLRKYYNDYNLSKIGLYKRIIYQRKPGHLAAMLGQGLRKGLLFGVFDTCQQKIKFENSVARVCANLGLGAILSYATNPIWSIFYQMSQLKSKSQQYKTYQLSFLKQTTPYLQILQKSLADKSLLQKIKQATTISGIAAISHIQVGIMIATYQFLKTQYAESETREL